MSISPQSLARTRDKRSLRIPRKFEDFSLVTSGEIPPEAAQPNYKNFAEALKMKGKHNKRQNFSGDSIPEPNVKKLSSGSTAAAASDESTESIVKPDIATPAKRPPPRQRTTPPTSNESNKDSSSKSSPAPTPTPLAADLDLECKETAPTNIDFNKEPATEDQRQESPRLPSPVSDADMKSGLDMPKYLIKKTTVKEYLAHYSSGDEEMDSDAVQNIDNRCHDIGKMISESAENVEMIDRNITKSKPSSKSSVARRTEVNVKKSPFYPSITISNGCKIGSGSISKPPADKKTPSGPPVSVPPNSPRYTPRKKSSKGGQSLMAKPNGHFQQQSQQPPQPITQGINNSNNRLTNQQQKYSLGNFPSSMQYPMGTRLLTYEPIYLPRNVPSIAPITVTLQQIANQARRPPFLSKRAAAYIAYQDERKFEFISSTHKALIKIANYLEVRDLLNLTQVNKTWKSIIDSDAVWRSVRVTESRITDSDSFANRLKQYKTEEIIIDEYSSLDHDANCQLIQALTTEGVQKKLRKLKIKTTTADQNKFALELLCAMNHNDLGSDSSSTNICTATWKVKVWIDEFGLASVPISCESSSHFLEKPLPHCYKLFPNLLISDGFEGDILVELGDLEDAFDHREQIDVQDYKRNHLSVLIEPI